MRILIVEDDYNLAAALEHIVKEEKYFVDVVHDGEDGLYYAMNNEYDVIILDVMLPKMNGFDVIKQLRREKISTPTIMLTAKGEISDKVTGLDCGADDYMVKPFEPKELLARIRALSRRIGEVTIEELDYEDLKLNLDTQTLMCESKSVQLSAKEFSIMNILMANKATVTQKEDLIVKVWGYDSTAEDNNVEAYISFLRKKIAYLDSKVSIKTIRKVGYKLERE